MFESEMKPYQAGALGGVMGTIAHTLVMFTWFRFLPRREQYPVPPREITAQVARKAGVSPYLDEKDYRIATWISHFAYGALAGVLYAPFASGKPRHALMTGTFYGLAVWAVSYLGWIPRLGLLKPATEHPPGRNAMMIAAHIAWGAVTGWMTSRLKKD